MDPAGTFASPYLGIGNNPVIGVDPNGEIFFIIPQISFNGGFSMGIEIGVGFPGILSASISGGVSTESGQYWSVQGYAGGFYAGYGNNGFFAGYGYQWKGLSVGYDFKNQTLSAGYGFGNTGVSTFGASAGLNYSFKTNKFGYDIGGSYTYIFEKPTEELLRTYEDTNASNNAIKQKDSHDCLLAACAYMGIYSYEEILNILGASYVPGKGSNTKEALDKLYPDVDAHKEVYPTNAQNVWNQGGKVVVAKNRNHAVVLLKIEQYKVTFKYRKRKTQTRFKYKYMDPAKGNFITTGRMKHYKQPTYLINNNSRHWYYNLNLYRFFR